MLAYLVFIIGLAGVVFNYQNFLITMLCIELMYLGIVAAFAIIAVFTYDVTGQIYALVTLILAACESAIGLGLLIVLFRYNKSVAFETYQELRG
jgi:NADH-quinone oxidoreductase subunit K